MRNNSIIRQSVSDNKGRMILVIIFGLISVISGGALLYVSGFLISKSSLKVGNILMLQVPVVLTRTFSLSQATFAYVQRLTSHDLVLRIIEKMRSRVYKILEPMALRLKKEYKTGDLLGLISEDIEHLQNVYLKSIFPSIISLVLYVLFITFMFGYDKTYALLATLFGLFILFFIPLVSLLFTRKNFYIMKDAKHSLYRNFTTALFGLSDLLSANKVDSFIDEYREKEDNLLKKESYVKNFIHIREFINNIFAGLVAFFMIYSCKSMTINNEIENVYIASLCMMVLSILSVAVMTSDAVSNIPEYEVSINRVKDFYKNEEKEGNVSKVNGSYDKDVISIKNLSFGYSENKTILKDISLDIKRGEKVAILGKSGVGKSTLIKLLIGTYTNYKGEISIFGNTPSDKLLGEKISLLNQSPYLFDMTLEENLKLGLLDKEIKVTDSKLYDVLEKVQLKNLVTTLDAKLKTSVHEAGGRFSGGEKQRIVFARTLLQNTDVLLLDEPTVALDPKTESNLLKTIFENSKDKTIIWITHHLNAIHNMDRIIFINDGEIEMDGSHSKLYKTNEKYKKLYDMDRGYSEK